MKQILKLMALSATPVMLLASGLTASAQNLNEGEYKVVNGIAYNKSATLNTDGTYTIKLETFVTGEVKIVKEVVPADIALVLDFSGSMKAEVPTGEYKQVTTNTSYNNAIGRYYYEDGKYYPLEHGKVNTQPSGGGNYRDYYYVYFTRENGKKVYLGGKDKKSLSAENMQLTRSPNNLTATSQNFVTEKETTALYIDKTYIYEDVKIAKIDLLKTAVKNFIDNVAYNDTHNENGEEIESVGHQIGIVTFASNAKTQQSLTLVSSGVESMKKKVEDITIESVATTQTDLGISRATGLAWREKTSKVIVLFTDGEPGTSTFDTAVANRALESAKTFKEGGTIYAIGLIENPSDNAKEFMNYVSSNYPEAESMTKAGNQKSDQFYKLADGADLSAIFEAIANEASGGAGSELTSESIVTVDVVASSFAIPEGVTPTLLLAPLTGQTKDPENRMGDDFVFYTFGETPETGALTPAQFKEKEGDQVEVSVEDGRVSVSGFDYSKYWCGPDDTSSTEYHEAGYKTVLTFTVEANEDAVGGPAVETNDDDSGIYVDGVQILKFNKPTVSVPVSIWIQKNGLEGNDSAVFTIYYADPTASGNEGKNPKEMDYKSFTKVIVNNGTGSLVKVTGLDPNFYYKIKEDVWAWSYDRLTPEQFTSEVTKNPIVFENKAKETDYKHAEATVQNIFVYEPEQVNKAE